MPGKYGWCISQILCWMNVQRVVEYFLFLDDVYILVSISLCIFPALALWKDEKIKVLSSTFFEVVICMCTYEVLFSITRTWNPRMKVMQGEKFYIVKGNSREIRAVFSLLSNLKFFNTWLINVINWKYWINVNRLGTIPDSMLLLQMTKTRF